MNDYISEIKAEGYTSLRETHYNQQATFPLLNDKIPDNSTEESLIDLADALAPNKAEEDDDNNDILHNIDEEPGSS